jgi:hypothetical protein
VFRWSLTLGIPNADLPVVFLTRYERWLHAENEYHEEYCTEGVGSTETGDKKFQVHLQGMFASHSSTTVTGRKRMIETFDEFLGRQPSIDGTKMTLKPFGGAQMKNEMGMCIPKGGTDDV